MRMAGLLRPDDDPGAAPTAGAEVWDGGGEGPMTEETLAAPLLHSTTAERVARRPSLADALPWRAVTEEGVVILNDLRSSGVVLEVDPVACEARPEARMAAIADAFSSLITSTVPELDWRGGPFVLQFYCWDDPVFHYIDRIRAHVAPEAREGSLTREWIGQLERHYAMVGRAEGIFVDGRVSGAPWRGRRRRVVAALSRRVIGRSQHTLEDVVGRLENALRAGGVNARRWSGAEFEQWLRGWFGGDHAPPPASSEVPLTALLDGGIGDLAARCFAGRRPWSDKEGNWWFNERPHRFLTIEELDAPPLIGHLSAERPIGDRQLALLDTAPPGTIYTLTVEFHTGDEVRAALDQVVASNRGERAEARKLRELAEQAIQQVVHGHPIRRTLAGFFLRAPDAPTLKRRARRFAAQLAGERIRCMEPDDDLLAGDSYIRALPFAYDPRHDRQTAHVARWMSAQHIAHLLPLYGRSRGTGHPGLLGFNRLGEPLEADPLAKADRMKSGHLVMFGPTGSGKSAQLVATLLHAMALHRPRLFIVEAGNSFGLLCDHFEAHGLRVHRTRFTTSSPSSLPPFADAMELLEERSTSTAEHPAEDEDGDAQRDPLGEMEMAAFLMVTGGEQREAERYDRADRYTLREGILAAARACRDGGRDQVLTEDVAAGLESLERDPHPNAGRMAAALRLYCSGIHGRFFNQPGEAWSDQADVIHVDLGILAQEGYEDALAVAMVSLMRHMSAVAEKYQYDERQSLCLFDEAHILATNPLLAPFAAKISKMWRKLGFWLWLATQNLEDYPDVARKLLLAAEWWLCLTMPAGELEHVKRFRPLSTEQEALMLAAVKEPGHYTEGLLMTDALTLLMRFVQPALALALAQSEQHEKAVRAAIMRERGCSELEAVYEVARRIEERRNGH